MSFSLPTQCTAKLSCLGQAGELFCGDFDEGRFPWQSQRVIVAVRDDVASHPIPSDEPILLNRLAGGGVSHNIACPVDDFIMFHTHPMYN